MLSGVRKLAWLCFVGAFGVAFQDHALKGYELKGNYSLLLAAVMVVSVLTLIFTSDRFLDWVRTGPRLVIGSPQEELRNISGDDLQVLVAPVYNKRDAGGQRMTAVDVVPKLEAFQGKKLVTSTRGSWSLDQQGKNPSTVTFRPTHESHDLEIVSKYSGAENAWLAGQAEAKLAPGTYKIRASLRGDGLKKPAIFEWYVRHGGKGKPLLIGDRADRVAELPHRQNASQPATALSVSSTSVELELPEGPRAVIKPPQPSLSQALYRTKLKQAAAAHAEADELVGRVHLSRNKLFALQQNPLASLARSLFPTNELAGEVRAVIHDSDRFVRRHAPELATDPPRFTSVSEAIEATDVTLERLRQVQIGLRGDGQ